MEWLRLGHHRFNTQPPEGGWTNANSRQKPNGGFNTQPPEGGWLPTGLFKFIGVVSTHSRLKAAGFMLGCRQNGVSVFQHTAA